MRKVVRFNRLPIIIIYNECTINGTGDLKVEQEIEEEEGAMPRPLEGLASIVRGTVAATLGAFGVATKGDLEKISEGISALEKKV